MIFPQSMIRLSAIILSKDTDSVTKSLLNEGIIDFTNIHDKTLSFSNQLSPFDTDTAEKDIFEIRSRIEQLMSQVNVPLPDTSELNAEKLIPVDPEEVTDRLDELNLQIRQIRDKQKDIQQSINRKKEIMRHTGLFGSIEASPPPESSVRVATGLIRKSRKEGLTQALLLYPAAIHFSQSTQDEISAVIIYMSRDEERIGTALDRYQWQSVEFPPELTGKKQEILQKLVSSIEELNREQLGLEKEAEDIIRKFAPILTESWKNLTITSQCIKIQNSFGKTSDTVFFSGWLPCHLKNAAEKIIKKSTGGKYYIQWTKPEDDPDLNSSNIPVKLNHGAFLKPFQWVVENYSLPQYGSIDPTVIVAFSFLTMFGLMFGDAGHGLVLALGGAITALIKRKKRGTAYELARLIMYCGLASVAAGILFGSYFGLGLFKPLWFDYHGIVLGHKGSGLISDIYDILGITIKFGVAIIGCGLFLNMINCIRSKRYFSFFFDKGGILGSWFYAGGVYTAFFFVNSNYKSFPPNIMLLLLTGLPCMLFAIKSPAGFFIKKKTSFKPGLLADWFMDWIVELLELFSGYLSNTLSFLRIAGLGIAHVSLMNAFFQIASSTNSAIVSIFVIFAGNILVIALEGLSAGIQSLRLNYYEFFSKYFRGSGKGYEPVSLHKR